MVSEDAHAQRAVAILAVVVAALAAVSAFLADRRGGIDEIGLVNPPYMSLHYGRLTYPVHGHPDSLFVHPPTHYALVAAFLKLGFSLYYAEAIPTFLTVLLCTFLIARSGLAAPVRIGLLYGLAIASSTFNRFAFENYGMRPENHLAAALLAGLVLLEWARIDGWSKPKLFAGAAVVVFAAGMQYFAWPAVLTILVYALAAGRRSLAALAAGALSTGLPYLALFVIPKAQSIRAMLSETRVPDAASPLAAHMAAYHALADLQAGDGLVRLAFRVGIPMVLVSTLLLLSMRNTRLLAVAALPVQLILLFFAWHKHAYYYYPEIQLYCAATVAAVVTSATHRLTQSPAVWYGTAILCGIQLCIAGTNYRKPHWTLEPQVHELEAARAAGREILGPNARVGSRIGPWYASGGAYWHRISPDLFWNRLSPAFDVTTYAANFDAIAENQHMSFEARNGRDQNAATWYADGSWQLRGFFFAEVNPEISYLLFSAKPHSVTGFGLREGKMYRFGEDPSGGHAFVSLACPIDPATCTVGEGKSRYLEWSRRCPGLAADALFFSVIFQPEKPGRFEMDAVVNAVLPSVKAGGYPSAHPECRVIKEIRGTLSEVNKQMLIAKLRREDRPMRFYERILDMPGVPRILGQPPPQDAIRLTGIRLDRIRRVNDRASVSSSAPWKITTAPGMGAYAASIPLDTAIARSPCWIHFRVTVSKGTIGIGVLNAQKSGFVTEPQLVSTGQFPIDVYIPLRSPGDAAEVIIRSAEGNIASEVTLHDADLWVSKQGAS